MLYSSRAVRTPLTSAHKGKSFEHTAVAGGQRAYCSLVTKGVVDPALIRNIAIIAHVDHGKTTLVDKMLSQCGSRNEAQERAMDSDQLEQERGITIMAKTTTIEYGGHLVNIVDTPGHGDFGGEVERILSLVDAVVLLVDATEGPMAQTKFVLSKALGKGLKPIVVLNKMDRETARAEEVETEVFDLFCELDANDEQLSYTTLYASSRDGWVNEDPKQRGGDVVPLFEAILAGPSPAARCDPNAPFSMLVTNLSYDQHFGKVLWGRAYGGAVAPGDKVKSLTCNGEKVEELAVLKVLGKDGLKNIVLEQAGAGHIFGVAGMANTGVSDTLCALAVEEPLPADPIDPPVLKMTFGVNNSPLSGKEGTKLSAMQIQNRLQLEVQNNVALSMTPMQEVFEVSGRGALQLGILIENMRREGFELSISPPRVIYATSETGKKLEPIEELIIDVDHQYTGTLLEKLSQRKGDLIDVQKGTGKTRIRFHIPSRALIGLREEINADTHGTAAIHHLFHEFQEFKGALDDGRKGAMVSSADGVVTAYALKSIESRGVLFIGAGQTAYEGLIIGENAKKQDIDVNPVRAKQLTNFRASSKDENVRLAPPRQMTLESAIGYVREDELIEVTPKNIRLRKAILNAGARQRAARDKRKAEE